MAEFFRRIEKKYMLNTKQYNEVLKRMNSKMKEDAYGVSKICNIYFDSPNYELARRSIEKPFYKDKVRLRSYNTPNKDSKVYLEIKRKVYGVVTKRRIALILKDAEKYLKFGKMQHEDMQVANEIDYYFKYYDLEPKAYISYDRCAYYDINDENFRITFDRNIIARTDDLDLKIESYGEKILPDYNYVMEVKTLGAIPLWFVKIISDLKLQQCTYSKYGEVYTNIIMEDYDNRRVVNYV